MRCSRSRPPTSCRRRHERSGDHRENSGGSVLRGRASHLEGRGILSWTLAFVIALSSLAAPQHRHPHRAHHRRPHRQRIHPHWRPGAEWRREAACIRWHESRGQWRIDTGNGYYGAYQFLLSTWLSVGGRGYPHLAPPREQSYRAWRVWLRDGRSWREWGTAGVCGLD